MEEARVWTVYGRVSRAKYLIQGFAGAINRLWFFEYRIKFAGTNCGCSVSVCVCVWMCYGHGILSGLKYCGKSACSSLPRSLVCELWDFDTAHIGSNIMYRVLFIVFSLGDRLSCPDGSLILVVKSLGTEEVMPWSRVPNFAGTNCGCM